MSRNHSYGMTRLDAAKPARYEFKSQSIQIVGLDQGFTPEQPVSERYDNDAATATLNALAAQGWELLNVFPVISPRRSIGSTVLTTEVVAVLRREKDSRS